jgi:hypothetical protein
MAGAPCLFVPLKLEIARARFVVLFLEQWIVCASQMIRPMKHEHAIYSVHPTSTIPKACASRISTRALGYAEKFADVNLIERTNRQPGPILATFIVHLKISFW